MRHDKCYHLENRAGYSSAPPFLPLVAVGRLSPANEDLIGSAAIIFCNPHYKIAGLRDRGREMKGRMTEERVMEGRRHPYPTTPSPINALTA